MGRKKLRASSFSDCSRAVTSKGMVNGAIVPSAFACQDEATSRSDCVGSAELLYLYSAVASDDEGRFTRSAQSVRYWRSGPKDSRGRPEVETRVSKSF